MTPTVRPDQAAAAVALALALLGGCAGVSQPASAPPRASATASPQPAEATSIRASEVTAAPTRIVRPTTPAATPQPTPRPLALVETLAGDELGLRFPNALAVDKADNLYLIDGGNARIVKLTPSGALAAAWGSEGSEPGQFNWRSGFGALAVDGTGTIYVGDTDNHRIQSLDSDGTFRNAWGSKGVGPGQFTTISGIAVDPQGNVYVADYDNNTVQKFNPQGQLLLGWGEAGIGEGQFSGAMGLAIDPMGRVYVADFGNGRIQIFTPDGVFLEQLVFPPVASRLVSPVHLALNSDGTLYFTETKNNRIAKYSGTGELLGVWGSTGSGREQFNEPLGIVLDSRGRLSVADKLNHRVLVFAAP